MPPETRSASRGKVTITLTNPREEKEEKAKVTVTLDEPEKMVARVVHQLARKFPPESVMTIDARRGLAGDCSSLSTVAEDGSALHSGRRQYRLLHEEVQNPAVWTIQSYFVSDELDVAIPILPSDTEVKLSSGSSMHIDVANVVTCIYGKSGFIELCQPGYYNEHAHQNHHYPPNSSGQTSVPTKPGIGHFVQHVVVNNEVFDSAVPICPGQSLIHLTDGDLYSIENSKDVRAIFFSEKSLARFTASKPASTPTFGPKSGCFFGESLEPGIPAVRGCPTALVCARVVSDEALPLALSSASRAIQATGESRISVSLYDETGAFICQRSATGGVLPPGKDAHQWPIHSVRYVWVPAARVSHLRKPAQILKIAPQCQASPLADGNYADPCLPKDIDVILMDRQNCEMGAFVADRKPSLVIGSAADINNYIPPYVVASDGSSTARAGLAPRQCDLSSAEDDLASLSSSQASRPPQRTQHRRNPAKVFKSDEHCDVYSRSRQRPGRLTTPSDFGGAATNGSGAHLEKRKLKVRAAHGRLLNNDEEDAGDRSAQEQQSGRETPSRMPNKGSASHSRNFLEFSEHESTTSGSTDDEDELVSRRQAYFKPADIDYAIPLAPGQTQVKLVSGDRLKVDVSRTFVVAYDMKGFPMYTIYPDGKRHRWAANESGVGIHAQDYFMDQDLLYAVPIAPTQTEVLVNDGTVIPVREENVITVFYDAAGRPAFTYGLPKNGGRRRIRPGLAQNPGVASSVRYVWLIDCKDGSDEQFVVPVKGHQKKIQDPLKRSGLLTVARDKLTTLFYDDSKTPLYTKLQDGTLVSNGLTSVDHTTSSEHESYQRVYNNTSEDTPDIRSVRKSPRDADSTSVSNTAATPSVAAPSTARSAASTKFIQRQVPVRKIEYRDRIVEVPEVHVVEKHVEVEKIEYVTKFVKKKQIVERSVEHVTYVPKIETKVVERVIEIPKVIEVERPEIIEQKVSVDNFVDSKQEVVVAAKLIPQIVDMPDYEETVECLRLEPELVAVDVYVPKLVRGKLRGVGLSAEERRPVDISRGHFNSLVLKLNQHLGENYERLPLLKISEGTYPMLNRDAKVTVHQPTEQEILKFLVDTGLVADASPHQSATDR